MIDSPLLSIIGLVRRMWMFSFHPYAVFLQMKPMRTVVWTLLRTRKQNMSPAMLTIKTNDYAGASRKDYNKLNEYELHANDEL
jgi:hypothetical protein